MKKFINAKDLFVTAEKQRRTIYKQNPRTGKMLGRTSSVSGPTDYTKNLRAAKDLELDGKPGIGPKDIHGGEVLGRMSRTEPKPSKVLVERHWRGNRLVSSYVRKYHKD